MAAPEQDLTPEGWHTIASARDQWADAENMEDVQLQEILDASMLQCLAYAPVPATGQPVPVTYRMAQLLQARALWQSVATNPDGQLDANGFQVQVYPMDRSIRALLRPLTGVPVFGA